MSSVSTAVPPPNAPPPELVDLQPPADEGDRVSVTDVNGSVAHFEMSYAPPTDVRRKFMAPLSARLPSFLYLAIAAAICGIVVWGYNAPSTSKIFMWVVGGDRSRPLGSQGLAIIVAVSAIATVVRAHMRGVVVSPDFIEARYLLPLGIPKTTRWWWAQVSRIILDTKSIAIELNDNSWQRLPEVAGFDDLRALIVAHATKHSVDVTTLER